MGVPESQLELHYQPIVRLDGSGVYGAETFLRWRHPEHGVLRAGQWIPYAIESGAAVGAERGGPAGVGRVRAAPAGARLGPSRDRTGSPRRSVHGGHSCGGGRGRRRAWRSRSTISSFIRAWRRACRTGRAQPNLDAGLASLRTLGVSVWLNDFGCDGIDDETARWDRTWMW